MAMVLNPVVVGELSLNVSILCGCSLKRQICFTHCLHVRHSQVSSVGERLYARRSHKYTLRYSTLRLTMQGESLGVCFVLGAVYVYVPPLQRTICRCVPFLHRTELVEFVYVEHTLYSRLNPEVSLVETCFN